MSFDDWLTGNRADTWTWQQRLVRVMLLPVVWIIGIPLLIAVWLILAPIAGIMQLYNYIKTGKFL